MELGVVFPTTQIGDDPAAIRDFAQAAEDLGYARLLAYDHVLGAVGESREPPLTGPYTHRDPFHEPMVLFGYLAGCTATITLATAVLVLPQRQTALLAKQAAEVDVLSGGRLVLGVGIGWNPVEYEALGVPFSERGRRLEEQVTLLRRLWTEPVVDVAGRYHRIDLAGLLPRPSRPIPIWFGGRSPAAMRRAARMGDGFTMLWDGDSGRQDAQRLLDALAEQGRGVEDFPMERFVEYGAGPDAWERAVEEWGELGGACASLRTFRGGTPPGTGPRTPAEHIAALERFMSVVGTPGRARPWPGGRVQVPPEGS